MKKRSEFVSDKIWRRYRLGRDRLHVIKRQILRFPRSPRLVAEYLAYRRAIKGRDWAKVLERARWIAEYALKTSDRRLISEMALALERLSCFEEAATLRLAEREFVKNRPPNEWDGQELSGKNLLINLRESSKLGLAFGYRAADLVAKAAKLARQVTVIVEPRLVQTYRRSFPDLEIVDTIDKNEKSRFDFVTARGNLIGNFASKENIPDPDFYPLVADPAMVADLRAKYQNGQLKSLIGIFWHSSHHGKDLPDLKDWQRFIAKFEARFVSLQYGEVEDDIRFLGADRVIFDPAIDQMIDMDSFAAQIAALDAVVAISGTPVHVACALGVPTVVLRDDWFRRQWPVMTDRVPWYPSLRVVIKDGREWGEVFDDAWLRICSLLNRQGERH